MLSANTFTIRDASVADVPELVRLGWATEEDWPAGRILVGEIRGVIAAALAVDENRTVYAAVPGAPYLLAHIRARAAAMEAHERTPSLAERIRERLQPRTTAPV
ncbi:MAG TPA: hypothetical protein VFO81_05585 [Gaiellaceae bacterium]|nr:hypothetical protein [Gaiellaceae bacterium]